MLSPEEVSRLINAAGTLFRRTLLMALYGTGMHRSELAHLKVGDIDSQRMIIRVVAGKRGKDRDLPLSPALLETLREYWRWRKPKLYLFPTRTRRVQSEESISDKTVWIACSEAARRTGIHKRVTPQTLRHSWATHLFGSGHRLAHHPSSAWTRRSGDHCSVLALVATAFADGHQSAGHAHSVQQRESPSTL